MKLKRRRWLEYTKGRMASAATTGRRTRRTWERARLGTPDLAAEEAAGPQQQDADEEQVGEEVRPGAEVGLHHHEGDTVEDPPSTVPRGLPREPMTITAKAVMVVSTPMAGVTLPSMKGARTPAIPARARPAPKAMAETRWASMPEATDSSQCTMTARVR